MNKEVDDTETKNEEIGKMTSTINLKIAVDNSNVNLIRLKLYIHTGPH